MIWWVRCGMMVHCQRLGWWIYSYHPSGWFLVYHSHRPLVHCKLIQGGKTCTGNPDRFRFICFDLFVFVSLVNIYWELLIGRFEIGSLVCWRTGLIVSLPGWLVEMEHNYKSIVVGWTPLDSQWNYIPILGHLFSIRFQHTCPPLLLPPGFAHWAGTAARPGMVGYSGISGWEHMGTGKPPIHARSTMVVAYDHC